MLRWVCAGERVTAVAFDSFWIFLPASVFSFDKCCSLQ